MSSDLPSVGMAVLDEDTAVLETGSRDSGTTMFYWHIVPSSEELNKNWWSQPIPKDLELAEAEYCALVKGLRVAIENGYSMACISTNSPPVLNQLGEGEPPTAELIPFYKKAVELLNQFDAVRMMEYGVETRPSE